MYDSINGIQSCRKRKFGLQAEEVIIWAEVITEAMVQAIWQFYVWQEVYKE